MSKRTILTPGNNIIEDIQTTDMMQSDGSLFIDTIDVNTISGTLSFPCKLAFTNSLVSSDGTTAAVIMSGGLSISNTTDATSSTDGGTLTTAGGIAVAKSIYAGNIFSNGVQLTNSGGGGNTLVAGTNIVIASNVISTSNTPTFSRITFPLITTPSNPAINFESLYFETTSSLLKSVDAIGNITTYQPQITKGDITVYDGIANTSSRLPIGSQSQVLTVDNTTSQGIEWSSLVATSSTNTDPYIDYFGACDTAGGSIIPSGGIFFDIPVFNTISRRDNIFTNNSTEITFNSTGIFIVNFNISVTATGVSQYVFRAMTSTGVYTEYPGSRCGAHLDVGITSGGLSRPVQTASGSFILVIVAVGLKLKFQATETGVTNTGRLVGNASSVSIYNPVILSPALDNSIYYESFDTAGTMTLTTAFQVVPFATVRVNTGTAFSQSAGLVTVSRTGIYLVAVKTTFSNTSAFGINTTNNTQVNLQFKVGAVVIPGHSTFVFCPSFNIATQNTGYVTTLISMTAGNTFSVEAQVVALNGVITRNVANASNMMLLYFSNSSTTQAACTFFNAYSNASITLSNTVWTDLTFGIARVVATSSDYTQLNSATLQITNSGTYIVTSSIGLTGSTQQLASGMRLVVSSNNVSFSEILGTLSYATGRNTNTANTATISSTRIIYFSSGQSLKVQGYSYNQNTPRGTVGIGNANLVVVKIEQTVAPSIPLSVFGSGYQLFQSLGLSSTNSIALVTKLSESTFNLAAGTYRIEWYYEAYIISNRSMLVVLSINNTVFHYFNERVGVNTALLGFQPFISKSGFTTFVLTQGIHTLLGQFCSDTTGTSATLQNLRIELFRIV